LRDAVGWNVSVSSDSDLTAGSHSS
jgi:hypothetical protein